MMNIKDITKKLEDGVKAVFDSEKYKQYLDFMGKFHDYSVNNCILIMMQKPDASLVAGYKAWQTKFGRQVRKGEKAIQIIAPVPRKALRDVDGEEKEVSWMSYRAIPVFDVSQTDGEELPQGVCTVLESDVDGFEKLIAKLEAVSPYPVSYEEINSGANGFCSFAQNKVVVKQGLLMKLWKGWHDEGKHIGICRWRVVPYGACVHIRCRRVYREARKNVGRTVAVSACRNCAVCRRMALCA